VRLVHNPYDSVSLRRVINVPTRGIGAGTWQKIEERADITRTTLWDVASDVGKIEGVRPSTRKAVESFVTLIAFLRGKRDEYTITKMVEEIIENTGYVRELEKERSPEAQSRIENIRELLTVTQQFEATSEDKSLQAFLEQTALIADIDSLQESVEGVTMMTLHSAKGLEFPVVFLVAWKRACSRTRAPCSRTARWRRSVGSPTWASRAPRTNCISHLPPAARSSATPRSTRSAASCARCLKSCSACPAPAIGADREPSVRAAG
jgi:superfamily I DNA/RNA helicase